MTYNPRWPHTFVILPEFLDEDGLPITDENGIPVSDPDYTPPEEVTRGGAKGGLGDKEPGSGSGSGPGSGSELNPSLAGGNNQSNQDSEREPQDSQTGDPDEPTPGDDPADDPTDDTPAPGSMVRVVYDDYYNPRRNSDGSFVTETVTEMPWGYRTATGGLKTAGEVIVADYKISCPMMLTELPTGTILVLTDYTHTFRMKVLKVTTYNWGTNIWGDNIKN